MTAPDDQEPPPRVAVVIPVFERPRQVLSALESVLAQSAPAAGVVVVDDGSADGTPASIRSWLERRRPEAHVLLLEQPHRGVGAARNRGVAALPACDAIAFLDSDDIWPPDFLERASARLLAAPDAVACSTDQAFVSGAPSRGPLYRRLAALEADATQWLIDNDGGLLSATLLRAEALRRLGGFSESLATGQDYDLALRLSRLGRWLHAPGAPVRMGGGHLRHPGERDHLSARYDDRHRRWAEVLESFATTDPEWASRSARSAPALARRWRRAALELARPMRFGEAALCMRRSAGWWWRAGESSRSVASWLVSAGLGVAARVHGARVEAGSNRPPR